MSSPRTALVTGASAGIGAELARVFAANGYRLVLVARRRDRLEALAAELRDKHGTESQVVVADLARPEAPDEIFAETERAGIAVDVLVNNAGYGEKPFPRTDWPAQDAFLRVLLTSVCHLTHHYLPGMSERGYGRILNVASVAAWAPSRRGDLYVPIKSFVVNFTKSLDDHLEQEPGDVRCTASCPGFTYSEFHDVNGMREHVNRMPKFLWRTADRVAREAYEACLAGKTVHIHGPVNRLLTFLMPKMPTGLLRALTPKR